MTTKRVNLTEPHAAHAALDWLAAQGWRAAHGPDIARQARQRREDVAFEKVNA